MERNRLSNFGRQSPKQHSCIIISKSDAMVKEEKSFKRFSIFFALAAILFNGEERFEQFM